MFPGALFNLSLAAQMINESSSAIQFAFVLRLHSNGIRSEGLWPQLIQCAPILSIAQYFRKLCVSYLNIRMAIVAYLKVQTTIV